MLEPICPGIACRNFAYCLDISSGPYDIKLVCFSKFGVKKNLIKWKAKLKWKSEVIAIFQMCAELP